MTEILNVKNCGLQFAVGYVKKKDSWSLGWTSNPYYRILVSYVYSSVQKYFLWYWKNNDLILLIIIDLGYKKHHNSTFLQKIEF